MHSKTALVVIDLQLGLLEGAYRAAEVCAVVHALAARARNTPCPVLYLQHCHSSYAPLMKGQPGWDIHPLVAPKKGDHVIEKRASDGFYETTLLDTLRSLAVTELAITGMQTDLCVDTTCRAALSHGFDVTLVADAHTTGDSLLSAERFIAHHNHVLQNLAHPRHVLRAQQAANVAFNA